MSRFSVTSIQQDVIYKRFIQLFPNRFDSKVRINEKGDWKLLSRYYQLSDKDLLDSLNLKSSNERAIQIEERSNLITLHIGREHAIESIKDLRKYSDLLGIGNFKVFQVDGSSSIYIYVLLSEVVELKTISQKVSKFLGSIGLEHIQILDAGQYAVFPLQKQFAWINDQLEIVFDRKSANFHAALGLFMSELESNTVRPDSLIERIDQYLNANTKSKSFLKNPFDSEAQEHSNKPEQILIESIRNKERTKSRWIQQNKNIESPPSPYTVVGGLALSRGQLFLGRPPPGKLRNCVIQ